MARVPGRAQDVQALHGWQVPALGERPDLRGHRRERAVPRERGAGLPQGRPRRRRRRPQGVAGWSGATAYNRGQVLYRVAELLEGRREQFVDEVAAAAEGLTDTARRRAGQRPIDRWVWYAGWTDKIAAVLGVVNPVAGPFLNFTTPEPTGVVAVLAPQRYALLGLVSVRRTGDHLRQHRVVVASQDRAAAGRDARRGARDRRRPGRGGQPADRAHRRAGAVARRRTWTSTRSTSPAPSCSAVDLERTAADTVKRVLRPVTREQDCTAPARHAPAPRWPTSS